MDEENRKIIKEKIDQAIKKIEEYGDQAEQFSLANEKFNNLLEHQKSLINNVKDLINNCNIFCDETYQKFENEIILTNKKITLEISEILDEAKKSEEGLIKKLDFYISSIDVKISEIEKINSSIELIIQLLEKQLIKNDENFKLILDNILNNNSELDKFTNEFNEKCQLVDEKQKLILSELERLTFQSKKQNDIIFKLILFGFLGIIILILALFIYVII